MASHWACNMSPLGRRRGPALRAESGGGRREVRPRLSPQCRTTLGLLKQTSPPEEFRGLRHSADPLPTPCRPPAGRFPRGPFLASSWPKLPPSCLLDAILLDILPPTSFKMPPKRASGRQDAILDPSWDAWESQKRSFSFCFQCFWAPGEPRMEPR